MLKQCEVIRKIGEETKMIGASKKKGTKVRIQWFEEEEEYKQ